MRAARIARIAGLERRKGGGPAVGGVGTALGKVAHRQRRWHLRHHVHWLSWHHHHHLLLVLWVLVLLVAGAGVMLDLLNFWPSIPQTYSFGFEMFE